MENQEQFLQKMKDIVKLAVMNNREITKQLLLEYLKDMNLDEERMKYVYDYLLQNKITITGYEDKEPAEQKTKEDTSSAINITDEEESAFLQMYMDEVGLKKVLLSDEIYQNACDGDAQAKSTIIDAWLARVAELAGEFRGNGLSQSDLIQEGNIGLLLAADTLAKKEEKTFEDYLTAKVREAMQSAVFDFREDRKGSNEIIRKADRLKEEIEKLEDDFGDKFTTEEIAELTGMELTEMQDLLKLTGEEES